MSSDYDPTDKATQMFFAETQNKLLYAEFDARRKVYEAELADKQDVEEIEAIIKTQFIHLFFQLNFRVNLNSKES